MPWELSHTPEALDNARGNLLLKAATPECAAWLIAVRAAQVSGKKSERQLRAEYKRLGAGFAESIAEAVFEYALSEVRLTDNGGSNLWLTKDGSYKVSFDLEKKPDELPEDEFIQRVLDRALDRYYDLDAMKEIAEEYYARGMNADDDVDECLLAYQSRHNC